MTEDNELIEQGDIRIVHLHPAEGDLASWAVVDGDEIVGAYHYQNEARAALTAYRNHQVEL